VFYGSFFAFGYAIPLSLVCVLYGLMLHRLRNRKAPSTSAMTRTATMAANRKSAGATGNGNATASSRHSSSKRRVTRLVIVVVVIFALSWLPAQVRYAAAEIVVNMVTELKIVEPECTGKCTFCFTSSSKRPSGIIPFARLHRFL